MASSSKDIEAAALKLCTHYTDAATTLFNEPSLGLYYVVEHVQRGAERTLKRDAKLVRIRRLDEARERLLRRGKQAQERRRRQRP